MFQEGAKVLANRKDNPMKPPAKGASKEQLIKYNAELRRVILQEGAKTDVGQHKTQAPTFLDAKNTMVKLNEELFTVANWVSIDKKPPTPPPTPSTSSTSSSPRSSTGTARATTRGRRSAPSSSARS